MCGAAVHFVLINNKRPNGQLRVRLCVCGGAVTRYQLEL